MGELSIVEVRDYASLKQAVGQELTKASQSFVRIGYLLKRARDEAGLLKDSGYSDMAEFAQAEFGLDRSQVSRFVRINDRFSIGGYSEHLQEKYEQFGSSKLSLMLLLPDEINEEISPEYSKSDINAIKTEYEAEQKISDLEVMMEKKSGPDDFISAVVKELNDEHPDTVIYFHETCEIAKKLNVEVGTEDVKEAFMPDGDRTYTIRISGRGRLMVNMKEDAISVVNMRDPGDKTIMAWDDFFEALMTDMATRDFTLKEDPPKEKSKKVEKSKTVEPVQSAENLNAEADVEQCEDNVAQSKEKFEETPTAEPTEAKAVPAAADKNLTSFQEKAIYKLDLVKSIITRMETTEENWNKITDMLRDMIIFINENMFNAVNGR